MAILKYKDKRNNQFQFMSTKKQITYIVYC